MFRIVIAFIIMAILCMEGPNMSEIGSWGHLILLFMVLLSILHSLELDKK